MPAEASAPTPTPATPLDSEGTSNDSVISDAASDTSEPFRTFIEDNLAALAAHPDREVLVYEDRRLTAGQFNDLVHRMAHAIAAQGVTRESTVTLLSGNLPETIAARYAANLVGCRVNHLYNKLSADVQAAIVQDVETQVLIVDPYYADRAVEIIECARAARSRARRGQA